MLSAFINYHFIFRSELICLQKDIKMSNSQAKFGSQWFCPKVLNSKAGLGAQSNVHLTGDQEVAGLIVTGSGNILS